MVRELMACYETLVNYATKNILRKSITKKTRTAQSSKQIRHFTDVSYFSGRRLTVVTKRVP